MTPPPDRTVAVVGATGYVGGRLVPRLLAAGFRVRAISRSLAKLKTRPWATHPQLEIAAADALDETALGAALSGCDIAYYLVHSMNPGHRDFSAADRQAATAMREAAARAGLTGIVYLGGLGEEGPDLSPHLRSRTEVAALLGQGPVPVLTLRAAMIIGSGSASFEILRYLVERLPVMITPRWVDTPCQPIAIRNVLAYLVGCLDHPELMGQTLDIGGPDCLTYRELMRLYAEEAGLGARRILPVPVFTPKLSSYWIHLVTPVPAVIARPLAEGLKNPVVCRDNRIRDSIPQTLLGCREAIRLALALSKEHAVETHWSDAGRLPPPETVYPGDPQWSGGTVYRDCREIVVQAPAEDVWRQILRIGGETGWYYGNTLWRLRGLLDRLVGGVGDRRGRRDPETVLPGDALDFWRVLSVEEGCRLRLLAEMKLPGQALLEFEIQPAGQEQKAVRLVQTAWFVPRGLLGLLYWFAVTPLHALVFTGMLRGIARSLRCPILQDVQVNAPDALT